MTYRCEGCGCTSESKGLHRDQKGGLDGFWCHACYHRAAVAANVEVFSLGIVGENGGWTESHTLPDAILCAVDTAAFESNIDMGICINAPIGGSYDATAIIRCDGLFLKVADLSCLHDMDSDEQVAYVKKLLNKITFDLMECDND